MVTQFGFLWGHIARQPSRATTLRQSQQESMETQPPLSSQSHDVESDSSHAGEVTMVQASRALAHNTRDDPGAGPSRSSGTPLSRSENASPQPNPSSKRKRVISPPQQSDAVERLLATNAEKQRSEDELRNRLLNPDTRRAFSDFIASSLNDIDETLWDTYTHEAYTLLMDFKRRSRALALPPTALTHGNT